MQSEGLAQPSQQASLEVANNNSQSIRDSITDAERTLSAIEDFLSGPRPEKETQGNVESCPSGILAQLCQIGASNHDRLCQVNRRLSGIAANLGVS